jgi:hypothetical protein
MGKLYMDYYEDYFSSKENTKKKRDKIYFGDEIEHININNIQSKIKDNIESYSKWISEYVNIINQILDINFKLNVNKMIFDIKRTYGENSAYEDDGNTSCEGFKYNILWAFPLGNFNSDEWNIRNEFAEGYLYFTYEAEERLFDNNVRGSRFFSIYLAGVKLPREDKHIIRIDYNNNSMSLNSVLNKGNIVSIVLKIKELQTKVDLIKAVENIKLFNEE